MAVMCVFKNGSDVCVYSRMAVMCVFKNGSDVCMLLLKCVYKCMFSVCVYVCPTSKHIYMYSINICQ